MTTLSLRAAGLAAAFLSLVSSLPAQRSIEDYFAPPNCWPTRGGGPSRSGATRTRAVRGPVEIAWPQPFDSKGTIDGEPLVWDDSVVVTVSRGRESRALCLIDLDSGRKIAERALSSPEPLEASMWGNALVCRTQPGKLIGFHVTKSSLASFWSATRPDVSFGPPLLVGERVYVTTGSELICYWLGRTEPLWSVEGRYYGAVTIEGNRLLMLSPSQDGSAMAEVDLDTHKVGFFRMVTREIPGNRNASIALMPTSMFVDFGVPIPFDTVIPGAHILGFQRGETGTNNFLPYSSLLRSLPAVAGKGMLARFENDKAQRLLWWLTEEREPTGKNFARPECHPEFAADSLPLSIAGPLAYAGASAFEWESGRILWKQPFHATERAIPARDSVLIVDEGKRLVCVRQKSTRRESVDLPADARTVRGRIVLVDGTSEKDEFTLDATQKAISGTKATKRWSLDDALLVEDEAGSILGGIDPLRGVRILVEAELARGYLALAKRAKDTADPALIQEIVYSAAAHDANEKDLQDLQKQVDQLRARKSPLPIKAALSEQIVAERDSLARKPSMMFFQYETQLAGSNRSKLDTRLLRAAVELDAANEKAVDAVRVLLPETLRPTGKFDALDALTYIDATRRTPVTFVHVPPKGEPVDESQRRIGQRLKHWRGDLYGIQSANLLIITPVKQHGTLARCLALGELVCATLQDMCSSGAPPIADRPRMVIELYESRDAYLKHANGGTRANRSDEAGAELAWTAGHYDAIDNVSRFYFPSTEAELDQVLDTTVHELTHHWLCTRCPAWPLQTVTEESLSRPGFWIVEGFACFVSDLQFDILQQSWSLGRSTSPNMDIAANGIGKYLPWQRQFGLSHLAFWETRLDDLGPVFSSGRLGVGFQPSERSMFYAQAAATARFLYEADQGAFRGKLMDFLRAYYTGDAEKLDLAKLTGVDADELGKRILEHSRTVTEVR